ncbi:MAG: methionyl-tRNA formyltransferase [Gammaproteobacteria bacterium]|nr:methionyl-tRNA formyltransferase [Gammaproteobacteria bacterium]
MASEGRRIVFAGTPDFAKIILQALLQGPEQVIGVLTQPDRPAGRGRSLQQSPVKQLAEAAAGVPVWQPLTLKDPAAQEALRALAPDLLVVVAYGQILPQAVLDIPRRGAINVHASLLPAWRGAAPIARAIAAGDTETGVSIMQMEAGLDSGPVLWTVRTPILPADNAVTLHDRLAILGAEALRQTLDRLWTGALRPVAQDHERATYARKLRKEEAIVDWQRPAAELDRLVRAFNPTPVAHTLFRGKGLRIWQARAEDRPTLAPAGAVVDLGTDGLGVACGSGMLRLLRVQPAGKAAMSAGDFLRGYRVLLGERLG